MSNGLWAKLYPQPKRHDLGLHGKMDKAVDGCWGMLMTAGEYCYMPMVRSLSALAFMTSGTMWAPAARPCISFWRERRARRHRGSVDGKPGQKNKKTKKTKNTRKQKRPTGPTRQPTNQTNQPNQPTKPTSQPDNQTTRQPTKPTRQPNQPDNQPSQPW